MTSLPVHGRIQCERCFAGESVEFDESTRTEGDWRITANPMAWGNPRAKIVVLGFSKGPTQAGALSRAPHDDIAYKGSRANVGKILQYLGLLNPQDGATLSETVSAAIADRAGPFHFGSLVRCTVERYVKKESVWKGSGGGMLDKFIATDFGRTVAENCVAQHLANLPSGTRLVVMFGMGQGLNYVDSAFKLYKSARGGDWRRISEVAYTDGKIIVVHVEHFASQGPYIPQWLDEASERGRYGVLAREAVSIALEGEKLFSMPTVPMEQPVVMTRTRQAKSERGRLAASSPTEITEHLSDLFSRRFSFVLKTGEELFPVRMKNRQTGQVSFRVSKGGTGGNTKESGIEVEDENEMVRYVLELGYGVRAATLDNKKYGLYKPDGRSVAQVRVTNLR